MPISGDAERDNRRMEFIGSIVLLAILMLALNHMAGGRPNSVLRPVQRILTRLIGSAIGLITHFFAAGLKLLGGSVKSIPPPGHKHEGGTSEKPPPRW